MYTFECLLASATTATDGMVRTRPPPRVSRLSGAGTRPL